MTEKTKRDKPYVSMRKIATYRKNLRDTEKGKAAGTVYTLVAFEHDNGITFSCRYGSRSCGFSPDNLGNLEFSDHFLYKLSMRVNKKGEKRFYFYKVNKTGEATVFYRRPPVYTTNPNQMRAKVSLICSMVKFRNKSGSIPKAQLQRMLVFIRAFLRKKGVSFKGLSNDPFSLMYQLCYPGSSNFDQDTLKNLGCSKFLLNDPVKDVLKTKGKMSRRLLYGAVKAHPNAAHTTLTIARYLRIHRSLDHSQSFLKELSNRKEYFRDAVFFNDTTPCLSKLKVKQLRVFDRLSVGDFIVAMRDFNMVADTFRMLDQVGGVEGLNANQIQYRSLGELHDRLSELTNSNKHSRFSHFSFKEDGEPMKLCALLEEKMQGKYKVTYAKDTEQLREQAKMMHNCSFSYHSLIDSGSYAIFCINDEFMFGVNLQVKGKVHLHQAVTYCNGRIDREILKEINNEIDLALGDRPYLRDYAHGGGWG